MSAGMRPVALAGLLLLSSGCSGDSPEVVVPPTPQPDPADPATVQLFPGTTFQTIGGWEAVTYAMNESPAFDEFIEPLLELVVEEVGINRIRLPVRSGSEHDSDAWSRYQNGEIPYEAWRASRYATVNDNDDPHVLDPAGFHFSELDDAVVRFVLPLKRLLEARGERLYVGFLYVAFTKQISGGAYHHDDPQEYAEFILAAFRHLDETFGLVPDGLDILLEPDNVPQWDQDLMGEAIVAVTDRLAAAGYFPDVIAPSTTQVGRATDWVRRWVDVGGIIDRVHTLSYHRYGRFSDNDLEELANLALANGLEPAMLEWWSAKNSYEMLHKDLKVGMNSSWQHGVLAGPGPMALFRIDDSDPSQPSITLGERARYSRQYFKYIRSGAERIGSTSLSDSLDPLAFVNADGSYVVVVKADGGEAFTVSGLPAGNYGVTYATEDEWGAGLPDQAIASGELLSASIPSSGVVTIFGK